MNSENQTWEDVKSKYLREIEKALSAVKHPRIREVLDDVTSHLEQRFAELASQDRNCESFQGIITEMGPASDYAELLDPGAAKPKPRNTAMYVLIAASAAVVVAALLLAMARGRDGDDTGAAAEFPQSLNESQKAFMDWTQEYFASYLDRHEYAELSFSTKRELEQLLIGMLESPHREKRYEAISCLAAIKGTRAQKLLLEIAAERREKDNRDRWMAIRALGIVGDKSIVPQLIPLIYHYNQNTRFWAQISLVRLTGVNFDSDWQAWGKWWNERGAEPVFADEMISWTSKPGLAEYADPEKQKERDLACIERLKNRGKDKAGQNTSTYIVTFKPVLPFNPQTSKELLNAFNRKYPRGVRTHHYRTQIVDNALVGHICVDTSAGENAVVAMLKDSDRLIFVESRRATKEVLEKHNSLRHSSLPGRNKPPAIMSKMRDEARKLARLLEQWPEDDKVANREEIELLVNQMYLAQHAGVEARFVAASGASLLGQTREAIAILKKAAVLLRDEKAPGMNLPVRFTAWYQIATIKLHRGSTGEAATEYEAALKNTDGLEAEWFLKALCLMHLAEIADKNFGDRRTVLKRLTETMGVLESVDADKLTADWAAVLPVFSGWAAYEYARVNGAEASANRLAYGDVKVDGVFGLAMMQMSLAGLEHPVLLGRIVRSDKSTIDSSLAKLALALGGANKGHNTESDKWLLNLSQSDSYFADFARGLRQSHLNSSTEH